MQSVKVYSKANPELVLAIRDDEVCLARANPDDDYQIWYKDEQYSSEYKDEEGYPCFGLINKATVQALKHSVLPTHLVQLTKYNVNLVDGSILWTKGKEVRDGFSAIRMLNTINLTLHATETNGIVLSEWNRKDDHNIWKIEEFNPITKTFVKVCSKADPTLVLSVRNGKVVLSRADPTDDFQKWYKDEKYGTKYMDMKGFPAFALVNKAIAHALKHSVLPNRPVQLTPYTNNDVDGSLLWTEARDIGSGFASIRMLNNVRLNIGTIDGQNNSGFVCEGEILVLSKWYNGSNQTWKIETC